MPDLKKLERILLEVVRQFQIPVSPSMDVISGVEPTSSVGFSITRVVFKDF
jgi:hypothetical protein